MITFDELQNEILTVEQVARYLNIAPRTVRKYYEDLGGFRVGPKLIRFNREVLRNAIQTGEVLGRSGEERGHEETEALRQEGEGLGLGGRRAGKGMGIGISSDLTLLEWATAYLEWAEVRCVKKVWKEKHAIFKRFFEHVNADSRATRLSPGDVLGYLKTQAETRSGYASNKERKNLVAAWSWGIKYLGLPGPNRFLTDRFPEERRKRYVPPERDFWKVYDQMPEGQDRVMLLTALHTAGRRGEIYRLRWEDLDFGNGELRLGTRKRVDGSMEYDWIPMTDELYHALLSHKQGSESEWVFPNPRTSGADPFQERGKWMRRLCDDAGVKRFGLHAIRHLTPSILVGANVPLIQIQELLRHRNIRTTERYLHSMGGLRKSMRVLERRGKVVVIGKEKEMEGKG